MLRPAPSQLCLLGAGSALSCTLHLAAVLMMAPSQAGRQPEANFAAPMFSLAFESAADSRPIAHQTVAAGLFPALVNADAHDLGSRQASEQTLSDPSVAIAETVGKGPSAPSARGRRAKATGPANGAPLSPAPSAATTVIARAHAYDSATVAAGPNAAALLPAVQYEVELLRHIGRFVKDPMGLISGGATMEPLRVSLLLDGSGNVASLAAEGEGSVLAAAATLERILRSAAPYPPPPAGRQTRLRIELTRLLAPNVGAVLSVHN